VTAISRLLALVAFALFLWAGAANAAAPQSCFNLSAASPAHVSVEEQDRTGGKLDGETAQCHARCHVLCTGLPDRPSSFVRPQSGVGNMAISQDDCRPSPKVGPMLRPPRT